MQSVTLDQLVTLVQHASQRHRDTLGAAATCGCGSHCLTCELRVATSSAQLLRALEQLESAQEDHERVEHGR